MKVQIRCVGLAGLFLVQSAFAQTTYLTHDELIKEFDRDVVYETAAKTKITHKKGGELETNGQDSRGRPNYDSGKFTFKEGKYCTRWVKTRANEESCFLVSRRDSDIVFHTLDGKDLGARREVK